MRVKPMKRKLTALFSTVAMAAGMAMVAPMTANAADDPPAGSSVVQVLGINDFHGRINANRQEAGAAVVAGAVKQLRGENPNTIFAGAGDFIGASTFPSFVDQDNPTIDAMNDATLQVSSVGNHEFDQGYNDVIDRVIPRADWEYLGANVKFKDGRDALPPTWEVTTDSGVKVGFVGAVTEHLDELVSPKGIAKLRITDIAKATNAAANKLTADGANIVILLVHEGYATSDCKGLTDPKSDLGQVIGALNGNVDAVISGHTHLKYNCSVPVKDRDSAENPALPLPVVQAGSYGKNLDQLLFTVDSSGKLTKIDSTILPLTTEGADGDWKANYPADPAVTQLVEQADAKAKVLGAKPLGKIAGPFDRAKTADGTENRGGESNLGNLVAEAQRWATESKTKGSAQIAFMNPGGLRADMEGNNSKGYPAVLTYEQAATVQPFANTLVNMDLTGAQIKTVLEQQWQPEGASRPLLRLGLSKGFTYTYDPTAAKNHHILQMWLNGAPIDPKATYSVTVNSFLAAGGDNFFELANGTHQKDTGGTDLQGMVDYMAANATKSPLPVDDSQHSVGITWPKNAPKAYGPGDTVKFTLSSLTFPAPKGSKQPVDNKVTVKLGDDVLGTFKVGDLSSMDKDDETGTADVSVVLPDMVKAGNKELTIEGDVTGTVSSVPITVKAALASTGINAAMPTAIAALLLLIGSALILTTRRRRVTSQA